MKLNEYQKVKVIIHYLTLAIGHSDFKIKTCFSRKLLSRLEPNSHESLWVNGNENYTNE